VQVRRCFRETSLACCRVGGLSGGLKDSLDCLSEAIADPPLIVSSELSDEEGVGDIRQLLLTC